MLPPRCAIDRRSPPARHPIDSWVNYPNDNATGKSLYDYNGYGTATLTATARAVKVSFDRPYWGWGDGGFPTLEINFVRWLERSGYDISYSTDVDTHASGARLLNHKGFLSAGHDEYWSKPMRDAAEAARDARKPRLLRRQRRLMAGTI